MEIDHAKELYDFWSLLIKRQSNPYMHRQWDAYVEAHNNGDVVDSWQYRIRNSDGWGVLPLARLHERGLILTYVGVWQGEPIIGLGYRSDSRAWYGELDLLFVLYPDGDFIVKSHWRRSLRALCRHTFMSTYRFRGSDHIHFDPVNQWGTGVSWVNMRDWQVRKPYFRISALSTQVLYRIVDGVIQVSPDDEKLTVRLNGDYDRDHHEQALATEYLYAEKRYRLHHRKWARAHNEPDPYAVVSPRRAKKLLIIQQMVQPYTPARSTLLKEIPEQVLQAQEG